MKRAVILIAVLMAACGSPPSSPESLWDSWPAPVSDKAPANAPASGGGPARQAPAKTRDEGSNETGETSETPTEIPEVAGKLVINEIFYDAVGGDTDGVVFIELHGDPDLLIENSKLNFVDGGDGSIDDTVTLPKDARVAADGFYVIADAKTGVANATAVPGADLIDNFDPQNGPDAVQLLDRDGRLVDAVAYGEGTVPLAENGLATFEGGPAIDVINGHSLERIAAGADTDDNAVDFTDRETPTPGL